MEKTIHRPGWWQPFVIGVAGALCVYIPLLVGVVPGFLAYLGAAGSLLQLLVASLVSAGLLYLLASTNGLWLLLPLLLPAYAAAAALRKKSTHFNGLLLTSAAAASAIYGLLCFPSLLAGYPAFYGVEQAMGRFFELFETMPEMGTMPNMEAMLSMASLGNMEDLRRMLTAQIQVIVPCLACLAGGVMGFVTYLLPYPLTKKQPDRPLRPMVRFRMWRVPKSAAWGIVTLLAATLIAALGDFVPNMDAVIPAVMVIALLPFAVQGLSLIVFLSTLPRPGCFQLWLVLPLLILTFPTCLLTVCLLGLIEQFMKIRLRYIGPPPS